MELKVAARNNEPTCCLWHILFEQMLLAAEIAMFVEKLCVAMKHQRVEDDAFLNPCMCTLFADFNCLLCLLKGNKRCEAEEATARVTVGNAILALHGEICT